MKPTRRELIGAGMAAVAGMAVTPRAVAQPAEAEAPTSQMRLSLAAYSFRDRLPSSKGEGTMTLHDLLDLAAQWRLDALEPTSYYFSSEDTAYLHSLKRKAFLLGLDISGTAIRDNLCFPTGEDLDREIAHVKKWVDHSVEFGAPCIRIFAGNPRKGLEREQAFAWATEGMKRCCDYAGTKGVFLAIENHGYLTETADDVLRTLDTVNHEWLGVNLDTGNFRKDPYKNIAKLAPKAINVQVKVEVWSPDGKKKVPADFGRIGKILKETKYRGYVALEYEAKEDPMTAVPMHLETLRRAIG
ncbi:MAG: sugar phosphate isomerase/epimerase [bacterium]|nr:sugar phosphate isomerase/epimerase [bacterium]